MVSVPPMATNPSLYYPAPISLYKCVCESACEGMSLSSATAGILIQYFFSCSEGICEQPKLIPGQGQTDDEGDFFTTWSYAVDIYYGFAKLGGCLRLLLCCFSLLYSKFWGRKKVFFCCLFGTMYTCANSSLKNCTRGEKELQRTILCWPWHLRFGYTAGRSLHFFSHPKRKRLSFRSGLKNFLPFFFGI